MGYLSRKSFSPGGGYSSKDSQAELVKLKKIWRAISGLIFVEGKDKKLVEKNFPVLDGLNPRNPRKASEVKVHFLAKLKAAVSVKGEFDFIEIRSIFVPEDKVKLVRQILHKQGVDHIKVCPIERIEQVYQATKGH